MNALRRYLLLVADIIGFLLIAIGVVWALSWATDALNIGPDEPEGLCHSLVFTAYELIGALVAAWVVLGIHRRPMSSLGLSPVGRDGLSGALTGVVVLLVGFGLCWLTGVVSVRGVAVHGPSLGGNLLLFLLVALAEEVISRGFVLGRMLDAGIQRHVALVLSALLFSAMHLLNPSFGFLPFVNIFLAGMLLGATYIYTRNLSYAIALHWAWNYVQGPVLGFQVSGTTSDTPLLQLQASGSPWLTGGSFGFEGSLFCTLLLAITVALVLAYPRLRGELKREN